MFDNVVSFFVNLDVSSIYNAAGDIAKILMLSLTPALLMIAIYVRFLRGSLDTFSSNSAGTWSRSVRDIAVWGTVLTVYFAIGNLVCGFSNGIYHFADKIGGIHLLAGDMSTVTKAINAKFDKDSFTSGVKSFLVTSGGLSLLVTGFFYYLSLLLVAVFIAILKLAHALTFSVAFVWGLIAIPVSISEGIKLLRGWGLLMGLALVWPLIQALLIALIRPPMITAMNAIITENTNAGVDMMGSDLLMTVLNLIFAATLVAAPFIASALVSNSPAAGAIVAPFISAAMGGVAAAAGGAKQAMGGMPSMMSKVNIGAPAAKGSFADKSSAGSSPRSASAAEGPDAAAKSSQGASPTAPSADAAKRQQRRGVILNQRKPK